MNISNLLSKSKHGTNLNDILSEDKKPSGVLAQNSGKSSGTNLSKQEKHEENNLAKLLTNLIGTRQQPAKQIKADAIDKI